jgi:hypothetical protein
MPALYFFVLNLGSGSIEDCPNCGAGKFQRHRALRKMPTVPACRRPLGKLLAFGDWQWVLLAGHDRMDHLAGMNFSLFVPTSHKINAYDRTMQ